ncbi:MAG: CHAT domain-containing protein, partial [Bacteroidota bacterium]
KDDDPTVYSIPIDTTITEKIENFRSLLSKKGLAETDSGYYKKLSSESHYLFEKLLAQPLANLDEKVKQLIIIPDAELGYLPFELLLTDQVGQAKLNFRTLPYLLKAYSVQYAYSTTLLLDRVSNDLEATSGLISYAPIYASELTDSIAVERSGRYRDAIVPLEWNDKEAQAINQYVSGETYLAQAATESAFKANAKNSRILHLAMHAFVDDEDPMNSKLVFTQDNDSIEDGFLHTFELYNMDLNAELVVLSACETGYGKLVKGEGIMSLARGFSYAGVPSVVMSHWQVDDFSTSQIMELFYKNLADGLTKDEALRQAKLEFLETTEELRTHPFFWGSFVLLGDASEIDLNDGPNLYLIIGSILLLAIGIILFLSARARAYRKQS